MDLDQRRRGEHHARHKVDERAILAPGTRRGAYKFASEEIEDFEEAPLQAWLDGEDSGVFWMAWDDFSKICASHRPSQMAAAPKWGRGESSDLRTDHLRPLCRASPLACTASPSCPAKPSPQHTTCDCASTAQVCRAPASSVVAGAGSVT